MCFEARQYDLLNENIVQLTKKRGQLKQVYWLHYDFLQRDTMLAQY